MKIHWPHHNKVPAGIGPCLPVSVCRSTLQSIYLIIYLPFSHFNNQLDLMPNFFEKQTLLGLFEIIYILTATAEVVSLTWRKAIKYNAMVPHSEKHIPTSVFMSNLFISPFLTPVPENNKNRPLPNPKLSPLSNPNLTISENYFSQNQLCKFSSLVLP